MEWKRGRRAYVARAGKSLKPSLVEWKLAAAGFGAELFAALKPSLVEWKPRYQTYHRRRPGLETFLGGMETVALSNAQREAYEP